MLEAPLEMLLALPLSLLLCRFSGSEMLLIGRAVFVGWMGK